MPYSSLHLPPIRGQFIPGYELPPFLLNKNSPGSVQFQQAKDFPGATDIFNARTLCLLRFLSFGYAIRKDRTMAFLNWSENYSVGIEKIDRQHKKLVSFLNELYEAMQSGKGKDVLGKVLADLVFYTKTHFATEEQLMAQYSFPDYQNHKDIHAKLASKVLELNQQ